MRVLQRSRLANERITWPALNERQVTAFRAWWEGRLIFGGSWFSATWPFMSGLVPVVRKFIKQPAYVYVGNGYWRVTADCEVRGQTELPMYPGVQWNPNSMGNHWSVDGTGLIASIGLVGAEHFGESPSVCITEAQAFGKRYFEFDVTSFFGGTGASSETQLSWVVGSASTFGSVAWESADAWCIFRNGGVGHANIASPGYTDTVLRDPGTKTAMCAIDFNTGEIWWGVNGNWAGSEFPGLDPATGVNPAHSDLPTDGATPLFFFVCADVLQPNCSTTLRMTSDSWIYPAPSGFTQWSS